MRLVALILGMVVAAWGGVIAYRAFFLEPDAAVVINTASGAVSEYPNLLRASLGILMLAGGACAAFFAARRKPM
ncbi:MAG TPA: hypothetical protein VD861_11340 [Pyrinomonadaceae bacterium]|nr:hypothetical protein [Pyrinomonadaceae bacterium]